MDGHVAVDRSFEGVVGRPRVPSCQHAGANSPNPFLTAASNGVSDLLEFVGRTTSVGHRRAIHRDHWRALTVHTAPRAGRRWHYLAPQRALSLSEDLFREREAVVERACSLRGHTDRLPRTWPAQSARAALSILRHRSVRCQTDAASSRAYSELGAADSIRCLIKFSR